MKLIVPAKWLRDILDEYINYEIVFSPIRHSEYTVEFHKTASRWWLYYGEYELLHIIAQHISEIPEYDQIGRDECNGYEKDDEDPTWFIRACVYNRGNGVIVIMA